ncbi:MAG: hypothetical protein F6K48_03325 [Okeania sp. SIO3H1]|nr:hypothetical protein [Okeania sp. SIO3H1]
MTQDLIEIPDFKSYIPLALRTESIERPAENWQSHIPLTLYRVNHALTGLITEISELLEAFKADTVDYVLVAEELGDAWWYMAILADVFDFDTLDVPAADQRRSLLIVAEVVEHAGAAFDVVKRRIYYNADDTSKKASWGIVEEKAMLISSLLCTLSGNNLPIIWQRNIAKLAKRYPDKFSSEKALNRDLDAERQALEGN